MCIFTGAVGCSVSIGTKSLNQRQCLWMLGLTSDLNEQEIETLVTITGRSNITVRTSEIGHSLQSSSITTTTIQRGLGRYFE